MFQTGVAEKIKTHVMFNNFSEKRAVYDIMCINMVVPARSQTIYLHAG